MSTFDDDDNQDDDDYVELEGIIKGQSASGKAWRIDFGLTNGDVWMPKSQVQRMKPDGERGKLELLAIPEWLAFEKGLI